MIVKHLLESGLYSLHNIAFIVKEMLYKKIVVSGLPERNILSSNLQLIKSFISSP
nr:MAG TPA: hypothetical protein [Caudoviricetes sp.]